MNARRDRDRLIDITEAAAKISSRVEHGRSVFDLDEDRQIVLTHLIQIIGEAASRLSPQLIEQHPEVPWRALIGMRHRVVHDYFAIDPDILWTAATQDVPSCSHSSSLEVIGRGQIQNPVRSARHDHRRHG